MDSAISSYGIGAWLQKAQATWSKTREVAVRSVIVGCALLLLTGVAHAQGPAAPTGLVATALSPAQVRLTWVDNAVDESGFRVERKTGSAGTFAEITFFGANIVVYEDTGLTPGTTYFYRVRANNFGGNSAYTNQASVTTPAGDATPPTAPTGLTVTAGASQLNLSWTPATDNVAVAGYRVEECSSFISVVCGTEIATTTGTTFSHTGLGEYTLHNYRVRAVDTAGNRGPYSNTSGNRTLDVTAPTVPSGLTAVAASASQINLAWTNSSDVANPFNNSGVSGYQVERCQGAGCTAFVWMAFSQQPNFADTGLAVATYRYRIRASDNSGNLSAYSNTVSATTSSTADTTPPSAPTGLTVTASISNRLDLSWTASTDNIGVSAYLIERCQGTGCTAFSQVATHLFSGTFFSDTGLARATTYRYRIRAADAANNRSGYSSILTATTLNVADTSAPSTTSVSLDPVSSTQINVSWTPATDNAGVTGYRLERCAATQLSSGFFSCSPALAQIAALTGTSFSDTGLSPKTFFMYRVRAVDAAGNLGGYSSLVTAMTLAAGAPTTPAALTATAVSPTRINLSWTASTAGTGVTGYKVERCQVSTCTGFGFIQIATPTSPSFSDSGLTPGTAYRYRVRALNTSGDASAYSNIASVTTPFTGGTDGALPTALTPNPLAISAGATGTLAAALSPAPTADGALNVTSSNTASATVPASVGYATGQTSVPIPVTGVASGSSIVTASANGGSASATVNVTPTFPTVTSLAPPSLTVTQGASGSLTVTISSAQTADTQVLLASSNTNVASVAPAVIVLAGQVSAQVAVSGVSPGTAQITATLNGSSASSQVTVTPAPASVVSLLPATSTVSRGASTTLALTISAAQSIDTIVSVAATPAGIVSVPAQVTVLAGQTTAQVAVGTLALGQAGVTASLNGSSASAVVNVVTPPVAVTALEPVTFTMNVGATSTFTVRINAAQSTGTTVALSVDQPTVLQIPASVSIPQGATSAVFTATGLAVGNAIITASANGTSKTSSVHVSPQLAAIVSLLPSPLPLQQGATGSLTVTINVAQEADTLIALVSSASTIAQVADTVTIAAGAISALIPVTAVAAGTANVTASVNGTSAVAAVQVTPPPPVVTSVTPATLTLPKGTPGTLRVTVSRAPNAATAVTLSSSNLNVASVPPTVNIPAGALFADFPVAANAVGQATITASLNGGSATATVTVAPAELVTLAVAPLTPTAYVGEALQFSATGTMTDGTTQDFTSRVTWTSFSPAVATINTAGLASALAAGTSTIAATFSFNTVIDGSSHNVSASTQLTVKQPVALVLTAPTTTLPSGTSTTVTVTSSDPAPAGGLSVSLSASGTGSATFPAAVTIPQAGTSTTFTVTGVADGSVTITATALRRLPGSITFTIQPVLRIDSITPTSGAVDSVVTLLGSGFDATTSGNQVSFRGINAPSVPATVLTASATQLTVRVPPLADTGPITLTNSRGTTQSQPFTVTRDLDYQLVLSPASLVVFQGASGSVQVQLSSTGAKPYTGVATLSALGMPTGVTASFSPAATLSGTGTGTLTLAAGSAAPGNYPITVRADSTESGQVFTRTGSVTLTVQGAAGVTGVKGRFVTPAGQGIAGVIVRADISPTQQPQTVTDAAGNFQLVGLPAGQMSLRFDATPANPLYPIWPYLITLPANQVSVIPDWTINPPPTADKFVPIVNATTQQVITDPRFPGLEVRLPAGVTITGYDGVVKTRIAVEKVDLTKLPVTAPPTPTGAAYQMYFGTPMGGIPSQRIPVTLPNDVGGEPGESVPVYFFDGSPMGGTGEWQVAGQGIVSADGKSVRMPDGTGIPRFCGVCGLMCLGKQQPAPDVPPVNRKCDGNPVDLSNGQEMPTTGGLRCGGLTPISTGMTYNPVDAFNNIGGTVASAGFGWVLDHDIAFLPFVGPQKRLVLPGNSRVNFTDDGSGNYKPFDDPRFDGAVITATSLAANEWQLKFKDGRIWRFKPFSGIPTFIRGGPPTFVTEMVDTQGNVLPITRQTNGRITSIGTLDRGVTMSYGTNGFVSEMRDTANRSVAFTYTPTNRIQTATDPDGRVTSYTYVDDSEFTAPAACGPQVSFGERLKTISYPGRPVPTENFYGPGRRVLRQTGYDGREYRFAYKITGACVTNIATPASVCTGAGCPDTDSWDNFQAGWRIFGGTVVSTAVTQPNGQTKSSEFNSRGVSTADTDAMGQKASTKLDAANRITERTDALGRTWKYQYDARGNVTQATDPLGRITNTTYDPTFSKPTTITLFDEASQPQTWTFAYDPAKGSLLTAANPLNQTTSFAYTPRGELQQVTDALNHATHFEYSTAGDLSSITDALSNVTRFGMDGAGRRIATTDPLGFATRSALDGADRVTSVTDARNGQTIMSYDPAGRLASVTNAKNVVTESYAYDSGDRMTLRTDALNRHMLYEYDTFGRLSRMTDRKGQSTSYDYDGQNQVTAVTRPEGVTRFTYDAVGRLTQIVDPTGTMSYAYDVVDRLVQETQVAGAVTNVVTYAYDALDRRISRSVQGVTNETATYGYDRANRLTSILYRGQTTTLEYDAAGRLTKKTLPNGIRQQLAYDNADRLLSVTYTRPDGSLIDQVIYSYDANGRRVTETRGASPLADTAFTAQYDAADRMMSITLTASNQTFALAYDENGNLASRTDAVNAANVTTYQWDSRNRLTAIQGPGVNATFSYDAIGRRTSKTVNGQAVSYVYDGLQAIGEIGPSGMVGLLTGLELDEVIARYTNAAARIYLTDALNTVLAQTREDQSIQNFYAYSPYGETSTLGDGEGNSIQYTARENDNTGLYFYRARYYDPVLKRFVSEDPIRLVGGINLYAYVGGDPVTFIDPLGLFEDFPAIRPPSFFELTTVQALRRDTTLDEAVERGKGFRTVVGPALAVQSLPYLVGVGGPALLVGCRAAPEVLPKINQACRNPLLALALGASICGSTVETQTGQRPDGKPPGSSRQYTRDRTTVEEVRRASERARQQGSAPGPGPLP